MSHPPCMVCGPEMALGGNNERLSGLYRFKKNTGCLWEFPPPLKGVCPFLKLENHRDKVRSASKSTKFQRRQWHPTPVLLPGKSHGQRSLVGCSPWGREEPETTERLHFHFSLSCTGEGNGNLLQCSCLENPRDGGAWWAAVYGVAQSWTRLKRLRSSSSNKVCS